MRHGSTAGKHWAILRKSTRKPNDLQTSAPTLTDARPISRRESNYSWLGDKKRSILGNYDDLADIITEIENESGDSPGVLTNEKQAEKLSIQLEDKVQEVQSTHAREGAAHLFEAWGESGFDYSTWAAMNKMIVEMKAFRWTGAVALHRQRMGCSAQDQRQAGCDISDLMYAGYTMAEALRGGYTQEEIDATGYVGAQKPQYFGGEVGFSPVNWDMAKQMLDDLNKNHLTGCAALHRNRVGCSAADQLRAGCTAAELLFAGYSASEARLGGYKIKDGLGKGFTAQEIKRVGFSAAECREGGFSAGELRHARFNAIQLHDGGFSASELREVGFNAAELFQAGFAASEMREAGFEPYLLKRVGFDARSMKDAGFDCKVLKNVGYTVAQLKAVPVLALELLKAGLSASDLRDGGYLASALLEANVEAADMRVGSYTAMECLPQTSQQLCLPAMLVGKLASATNSIQYGCRPCRSFLLSAPGFQRPASHIADKS